MRIISQLLIRKRTQLTSALSISLHPRRVWCNSRRRCWYGMLALEWRILEWSLMVVMVRKRRGWLGARMWAFAAAVWPVLLRGRRWRTYGGATARCHHCSSPYWIHRGSREQVGIRVIPLSHADSCTTARSSIVVVSKQKIFLVWRTNIKFIAYGSGVKPQTKDLQKWLSQTCCIQLHFPTTSWCWILPCHLP